MKKLFEKFISKRKQQAKDNRGLSIVELICAVAIFATLGTALSAVMIVSARSFQRSSNDVEVQQESQLAVNQINDLVVDTTAEIVWDSSNSKLSVEKEVGADNIIRYEIELDETTKQLIYSELKRMVDGSYAPVSPDAIGQILAENVTDFKVETAGNDGTVRVYIEIERNGKVYGSWYTISPRNGEKGGDTELGASIVTETEVTLEPLQEYVINANVVGNISNREITAVMAGNSDANTSLVKEGDGKWHLRIGRDETTSSGQIKITLSTVIDPTTAAPYSTVTINVNIRRVNDVRVNGWLMSGDPMKANAVYKITANALGTNLAKVPVADYDQGTNYKNPYYIGFSYSFVEGGTVQPFNTYARVLEVAEDTTSPYVKIQLLQDMPDDSELIITATPKHPQGTIGGVAYNKSGSKYADVSEDYVISKPRVGIINFPNGIKRGDDNAYNINTDVSATKIANTPAGYSGEAYWFISYRIKKPAGETQEPWTPYYIMLDQGNGYQMTQNESFIFLPQYEYEYKVILTIQDKDRKVLHWPHDESVIGPGTGMQDYTKSWADDAPATQFSDYGVIFPITKPLVSFMQGWEENALPYDTSFANPLQLNKGTNYLFNLKASAYELKKVAYGARIQKWDGTQWVVYSNLSTQTDNGTVALNNTNNAEAGKYRILLYMKANNNFRERYGTDIWDRNNFRNISVPDTDLYDETTGSGILYFELN